MITYHHFHLFCKNDSSHSRELISMKFVGSSKNKISGDSSNTFANAILVLCHQLTSDNFLSNKSSIHIQLATWCILLL